ncbi:RDD family protein [Streptomyces sp. NBC_01381]|uniref:RDD family protein n=1 Tax=Streptomyces sp. NBC_01381 TaxID=2903845 RepID=UPI0022551DB2|nr:RDD family protein [Streptomyces sp. NBC_01381]MCX4672260.1 RDD family protein [Streptomyces sp. NBC_01381]
MSRPPAVQGQRAGIVSRTVADVIDVGLVGALCAAALLLYGVGDYVLTGAPFALPQPPRPGGAAGSSLIAVGYLAAGWTVAGRTPGKQFAGLRVVCASGRPVPAGRAALRAVLCVLLPLGLFWVLVSRRNASIQDLLVRTAVLYDWGTR